MLISFRRIVRLQAVDGVRRFHEPEVERHLAGRLRR